MSNHLLLEYEEVLKRNSAELGLKIDEIDRFLNAICQAADCISLPPPQTPRVEDPDDEPLLRLAEASEAKLITTHNVRHLRMARHHGVTVLLPRGFLSILRSEP